MKLRFWLHVMDLIAWFPRGFGSRAYLWAVEQASDATDWGPLPDGNDPETPDGWPHPNDSGSPKGSR